MAYGKKASLLLSHQQSSSLLSSTTNSNIESSILFDQIHTQSNKYTSVGQFQTIDKTNKNNKQTYNNNNNSIFSDYSNNTIYSNSQPTADYNISNSQNSLYDDNISEKCIYSFSESNEHTDINNECKQQQQINNNKRPKYNKSPVIDVLDILNDSVDDISPLKQHSNTIKQRSISSPVKLIPLQADNNNTNKQTTTTTASNLTRSNSYNNNTLTQTQQTQQLASIAVKRSSPLLDTIQEHNMNEQTNSPPPIQRTDSELRQMRVINLAQKSSTVLLVDLLLGKTNQQQLIQLQQQAINELYQQQITDYSTIQEYNQLYNHNMIQSLNSSTNNIHITRRRSSDGYIGTYNIVVEHMCQLLLSDGADICYIDNDGNNAISLCIQYRNNDNLLKLLLKYDSSKLLCDIDYTNVVDDSDDNDYYGSPVDIALQLSQPTAVLRLLRHGLLPTAKAYLDTELCNDIRALDDIINDNTYSKLTLRQFSQLHNFERFALDCMNNVLIDAVNNIDVNKVYDMCIHGAEVDKYRDNSGYTLLSKHIKSKQRNVDIVRYLLQAGANCNILDYDTHTPAATYCIISHSSIVSQQIIELLCQYGLNVHMTVADTQQTLLQFAKKTIHNHNNRIIELLQQCAKNNTVAKNPATQHNNNVKLTQQVASISPTLPSNDTKLNLRISPTPLTPVVSGKTRRLVRNNISSNYNDNDNCNQQSDVVKLQQTLKQSGIDVIVNKAKSKAKSTTGAVKKNSAKTSATTKTRNAKSITSKRKQSVLADL